jgi:hypothetical protein
LGAYDFVKKYQESDPGAFAQADGKPYFSTGTIPPKPAAKAFKDLSYLEKLKLKTDNPALYEQMKKE